MPVYYRVGSERFTEEEYARMYGQPKPKLHTFAGTTLPRNNFEPYFDRTLGQWINSFSDQEKKVRDYNRKVKSLSPEEGGKQHSDGFCFLQDDHKKFKEVQTWKKYGKDIRREQAIANGTFERNTRGRVYSIPR